jgi:hypothetical protein
MEGTAGSDNYGFGLSAQPGEPQGGHLVIDGLAAQMHGRLPTSVLPTRAPVPVKRPYEHDRTTAHPVFHTRSLFCCCCCCSAAAQRHGLAETTA